jgi:ParB/RepB/Spo0J family partition protein
MKDQDGRPFVTAIPVKQLRPNPFQPRLEFNREQLEELAASIKQFGLLHPVVVRPTGNREFEIVAGERRKQAAKIAGLVKIPCIIREASDADMMMLSLAENDCRVELNPIERAKAYRRALDSGLTHRELSERLGRPRTTITEIVGLLELPVRIQQQIIVGKIAWSAARELNRAAKDPAGLATVEAYLEEQSAGEEPGQRKPLTQDEIRYARKAVAAAIAKNGDDAGESLARDAAPPAGEATIAAWRRRWIDELLTRLIEDRGPEAILTALGMDLAAVWREELAGPAFTADYFTLHDKPQLIALAAELDVMIDASKPKETIIRQLIMNPKTKERLPAELAS